MEVKIYDFKNDSRTFDIGELDNIQLIHVAVLSGDEVATIFYKNGESQKFDSSEDRLQSFYDGEYTLRPDQVNEWNDSGAKYKDYPEVSYKRLHDFC